MAPPSGTAPQRGSNRTGNDGMPTRRPTLTDAILGRAVPVRRASNELNDRAAVTAELRRERAKANRQSIDLGKPLGPYDTNSVRDRVRQWQAQGGGVIEQLDPAACAPEEAPASSDTGTKVGRKQTPRKASRPAVADEVDLGDRGNKSRKARVGEVNDADGTSGSRGSSSAPRKRLISDGHWVKPKGSPPKIKAGKGSESPKKAPSSMPADDGIRITPIRGSAARRRLQQEISETTPSKTSVGDDGIRVYSTPSKRDDRLRPKKSVDGTRRSSGSRRGEMSDEEGPPQDSSSPPRETRSDSRRKKTSEAVPMMSGGLGPEDPSKRRRPSRTTAGNFEKSPRSSDAAETVERRKSKSGTPKAGILREVYDGGKKIFSKPDTSASPQIPENRIEAWLSDTPDPFVDGPMPALDPLSPNEPFEFNEIPERVELVAEADGGDAEPGFTNALETKIVAPQGDIHRDARPFPTTGRHQLSTIASVETFGTTTETAPTEMASEVSQNTVTANVLDGEKKDASDQAASQAMANKTGLKRRLTTHADLISVLSLPKAGTKSIRSARSIRTNRSRPGKATIADLMVELATDETKYMRELNTLVDGVIPVLLTCVLSKSDSAVAAGLFNPSADNKSDPNLTRPIVDMGIALERLKSFHKRIPQDDPQHLLRWAQGAQKVYKEYLKSWRMGFQDVVVNLAPATDADSQSPRASSVEDETGLPRNADGDVINVDGERVDVAFLLKRPLVRLKYLAKTFKGINLVRPSILAEEQARAFQNLVDDARQRANDERARLEDEGAANIDPTRARDPRTLAPMTGVTIDRSRRVRARDYFGLDLQHSSGQRVDCRVELLLRDDAAGQATDDTPFSESSDDEELEDGDAPTPLLPLGALRRFSKVSPKGSIYSLPNGTLTPSQSASQAPYKTVPQQPSIAVKTIASIFSWSDRGSWDSLHPDECSIVITPGLIEAFEMTAAHSNPLTASSNPETAQSPTPDGMERPLVGLELTPLVPLRRGTALDISIRSRPTPKSKITSGNNIMFRSRNPEECEILYGMINQARINNPTYIALQNARGPYGNDYGMGVDRRVPSRASGWWGWGSRKSSYRASSRGAPSLATSESSIGSMATAFSALRRFGAGSRSFNIANSTISSRHESRSTSVYSSSSNSSFQKDGSDTPSDPFKGSPIGLTDAKIRLYQRETNSRWRDMGSARLSITKPPVDSQRHGSSGNDKRVVVKGKTAGEPLLDVCLGESAFERVARTGIALSIWEDVVGPNGEVGQVGAVGGVGARTKVYMIQMKSEAETAYTFSLVGKLRY
ncbi:MAG: hypothetical protein M1832_003722 [Thelocarpon impressellum]|nr:MAG: hypothetical protein M1832_003722 [Thelocarpon impressellum]